MGSIDNVCRLCAGIVGLDATDLLSPSSSALKNIITYFLHLSVDFGDALPSKVCRSCQRHLTFCVHFVDRCRRVDNGFRNGGSVEDVRTDIGNRFSSASDPDEVVSPFYLKFERRGTIKSHQ